MITSKHKDYLKKKIDDRILSYRLDVRENNYFNVFENFKKFMLDTLIRDAQECIFTYRDIPDEDTWLFIADYIHSIDYKAWYEKLINE